MGKAGGGRAFLAGRLPGERPHTLPCIDPVPCEEGAVGINAMKPKVDLVHLGLAGDNCTTAGNQNRKARASDDVGGKEHALLDWVRPFQPYVLKTSRPICDSKAVVSADCDGSLGEVVPRLDCKHAALLRKSWSKRVIASDVNDKDGDLSHEMHVCGSLSADAQTSPAAITYCPATRQEH